MKKILARFAAAAARMFAAGCAHLDTTPDAPADRVLTGTVVIVPARPDGAPLPPDTVVIVRIVDVASDRTALANVLGEQEIKNPGVQPLDFRIEYRVEDAVLRRQVNLEARISIGGKLAYYSHLAHPILPANAGSPHRIAVEPASSR